MDELSPLFKLWSGGSGSKKEKLDLSRKFTDRSPKITHNPAAEKLLQLGAK